MGRGNSSGGGKSSLDYLFGSDDTPKVPRAAKTNVPVPADLPPTQPQKEKTTTEENAAVAATAGTLGRNNNNYHRADGQNTGNFITDRPSTKVHSAPGGDSSLGYLFGGPNK